MAETTEEKNIRLAIAYDGTGFYGWQYQPDKKTIQGTIEEKIRVMVGKPVSLVASGRTDAGVHAIHQVANFKIFSDISPSAFLRGLNSLLPDSIVIKEAEYVSLDFHARYDASSKIYEYRVYTDKIKSPFLRNYAWNISHPINLQSMEKCIEIIKGIHDFSSFYSSGGDKVDPVRNMMFAEVRKQKDTMFIFTFEADGFLRHMVRNIMGTIVMVGLGRIDINQFGEILESKDRGKAGIKAPPAGLYLKNVTY
jgi:tRNA pseudouridine38-40 synthase